MSQDGLRQSLAFLMYDSNRAMNRCYERGVSQFGITRTQWTLLSYVARAEGGNQSALAEYMGLAPMTLTRQIDKLEALGLLKRQQSSQDRRTNLIYLTPKSQQLLQDMNALARTVKRQALAHFSDAECQQLHQFLTRMRDNLVREEPCDCCFFKPSTAD